MEIEIIQFIRPDGRQKIIRANIEGILKERYQDMMDCECRLTLEFIHDSEINVCIEHSFGDIYSKVGDFDHYEEIVRTTVNNFNRGYFQEVYEFLKE